MQKNNVIRQDERMLEVPRVLGSACHFASGRPAVAFLSESTNVEFHVVGETIVAEVSSAVVMCDSQGHHLDIGCGRSVVYCTIGAVADWQRRNDTQ